MIDALIITHELYKEMPDKGSVKFRMGSNPASPGWAYLNPENVGFSAPSPPLKNK
jgi:hypothetical protein